MMGSEATFTIEVDGKKVSCISTSSVSYQSFLPPVETLPKRERARLSGYLQMCEENTQELHSIVLPLGETFELHYPLHVAANAYGVAEMSARVAGTFVDAMVGELSALSGHTISRVAGEISAWGKGKTPEDWRRIWTGE